LTVEENIRLAAWTVRRQLSSSELDKRALEIYEKFPSLNAARQKKAAFLSGGQRRMLEISKCLMVTPSLVLIDEPTAGLAPKIAKDVYDKLAELNRLGMTILFVDQNIRQAVKLADYVYLLELGTNKLEAPGEQFRSNINQMIGTYVLGSEESYAV
jgi:branched-chain amino acid transport system ATP-binding protein